MQNNIDIFTNVKYNNFIDCSIFLTNGIWNSYSLNSNLLLTIKSKDNDIKAFSIFFADWFI